MLVTCTSAGTKRQTETAERLNGKMKTLKAVILVLLLGLCSFGVYHVGWFSTKSLWSTTGELEDVSKTLPLPVQLYKLQEQLYHLHWSAEDVTERALQEGMKQAKLPGFTGWAVQEIINQALKKLEEIQVPMPDYALKSAGAAVIRSRTSPSLRDAKAKVFLYSLPVMDYMRSPELILEPENHPGNCWPFPGSQGHVFIRLSTPVIPRAVTMDHVSGTVFHGESISGAPKDFAVYGFKEEHEEQGTFLGQFTFLAALNPSQTFQLKAVQEIINQALKKLEEIQVPMPDYALKSAGAAVIRSRTSPSLRDAKAKVFLYSLPVMDYMRSPELILEPENHPGNCWPFPGSQGHVFIRLSTPVIPRAVTMDHVSGTVFHGESISGAPKDFAVYGFKEEHEEQGTFLGQFTFLAALNPSQTFQLKAVQEIINQALKKLEEIQVPMPDYALKSAGAAVIRSRTSPSLRDAKAKVFLYSLPVMDYMRSPELILEPENHPGNCWPFPGSQGHVFIRLSTPVIPRAVTMDHVSGTVFHGESISGAPKDFAVYGFKEEHEEQGTFLGQFTFLAALNPSQTFQLKCLEAPQLKLESA
ncbi:hypothetical protein Q9966_016218 [Columba livia]|nr:hypothetical protein Q9966_016218 [Columba livia]